MSALVQKKQTFCIAWPMSALPPKADIGTQSWNVRMKALLIIGWLQGCGAAVVLQMEWPRHAVSGELALQSVRGAGGRAIARGSVCHRDTSMQQHLPFFGLHTLAKLPHCKLSPPHFRWLLAAPACGAIDSNISAADSVTISIRMIWLPVRSPNSTAI